MKNSKHQVSPEVRARAQAIHEQCVVLDAHVDIVIPSTSTGMLDADGESLAAPDIAKIWGENFLRVLEAAASRP